MTGSVIIAPRRFLLGLDYPVRIRVAKKEALELYRLCIAGVSLEHNSGAMLRRNPVLNSVMIFPFRLLSEHGTESHWRELFSISKSEFKDFRATLKIRPIFGYRLVIASNFERPAISRGLCNGIEQDRHNEHG